MAKIYIELYAKQLQEDKEEFPNVSFLADTTKDEVNWLQDIRRD